MSYLPYNVDISIIFSIIFQSFNDSWPFGLKTKSRACLLSGKLADDLGERILVITVTKTCNPEKQ